MQTLQKARKDDLAALGPHADWATKTLQYNDNGKPKEHAAHLNWLANGVRKDPNILTPEHKTKIEHFASMYHLPSVKDANLSTHTIESGLENLHQAEQKGIAGMPSKGLVTPKGHSIAKEHNGREWHNLGVAGCEEEGKAGNHCGNMPAYKTGREHERLLSLRGSSNVPGKLKQHLTFVNNNGYITEMKGNGNTKPKAEYHGDIVSLMEHPEIKGMVGGGFASGSNFDPDDVTDPELRERIQRVLEKKPNFFSPDKSDLHSTVAKDPFLAYTVTDKNAKNSIDEEPDSIARNNLSYDDQMALAKDGAPSSHWALAKNPNLHPDTQATLARLGWPAIHWALAKNPNLHPDTQATLAREGDGDIKIALARNPNLHPDLQGVFAGDDSKPNLRWQLALNPNLHPEVQSSLARDRHPDVRAGLASNPNLHSDLQEKIAQDRDPQVVQALAKNPNLHPDVQTKIAQENNAFYVEKLAANPNLKPDLQAHFEQEKDLNIREMLAANPNLQSDIQEKLVQNSSDGIRYRLANNPNLSPHVAKHLEADLRKIINQADEGDPNSIENARDAAGRLQDLNKNQLIQRLKSKEASPEFIKRYEFSHNYQVQDAAREALKKLGKSEKQGHAVLAKSHSALSLLKSFKQATVKKSSPCRFSKRRENA